MRRIPRLVAVLPGSGRADKLLGVVSLAFGLWCVGMLISGRSAFPAAVFPAYFMVVLLIVTAANRTMPVRWVAGLALLGATTVPLVVLLISLPFGRWLGTDSRAFHSVIVPLLENSLKVVPLLVLLRSRHWRYRATVGASDLLLLGAALGAGLTFYEDTLRGWTPGFSADTLMAMHRATPHRGVLYLFPHMRSDVSLAAGRWEFIGHGGGAALVGVALGLDRLLRGRLGRVPSWILPLVAWGWSVFDHGVCNLVSTNDGLPRLLELLWRIDLRGSLSSFVLYALILIALMLERGILRQAREYIGGLNLSRQRLMLFHGRFSHPAGRLLHLLGLGIYLQERRGLIYGHYYHAMRYEQDAALGRYLAQLEAVLRRHKTVLELPRDAAQAEVSLHPAPLTED